MVVFIVCDFLWVLIILLVGWLVCLLFVVCFKFLLWFGCFYYFGFCVWILLFGVTLHLVWSVYGLSVICYLYLVLVALRWFLVFIWVWCFELVAYSLLWLFIWFFWCLLIDYDVFVYFCYLDSCLSATLRSLLRVVFGFCCLDCILRLVHLDLNSIYIVFSLFLLLLLGYVMFRFVLDVNCEFDFCWFSFVNVCCLLFLCFGFLFVVY